MYSTFDIVRDRISGHPAVVLGVMNSGKTIIILDCKTHQEIIRKIDDVDPWKPPGGGGVSVPKRQQISNIENTATSLKRKFRISKTNIIRFSRLDIDTQEKIISICDQIMQFECVFA